MKPLLERVLARRKMPGAQECHVVECGTAPCRDGIRCPPAVASGRYCEGG